MQGKENPVSACQRHRAERTNATCLKSVSSLQGFSQDHVPPELIETARLFGQATISEAAFNEAWLPHYAGMTAEERATFSQFIRTDLGRAFVWQGQAFCPGSGLMWKGAQKLRDKLDEGAAEYRRRHPRGDPQKRALMAFTMTLLDFALPSSEILAAAHRVNSEADAPLAPAEVRELAEWCARRHAERRAAYVG